MKKLKKEEKKKNRGGAGDGLFYDGKSWGFRVSREGKDTRRKGFRTKTEAKEARILYLANYEEETKAKEKPQTVTLQQVFDHYNTYGAGEKAAGTVTKQNSLWRCHVGPMFGSRAVDSISVGEVNNYLIQLYTQGDTYNNFECGYAYKYVQGVLRFFYLLFGYAKRMEWIDKERYRDLLVDKDSRIQMPIMTYEDKQEEGEIETHTQEEIEQMRNKIRNSSLYVAFEIGFYCGLRISECFGLMWSDIDLNKKTLSVNRQMVKEGVHRVLKPPKTFESIRTIEMPDKLVEILKNHKEQQKADRAKYGDAYKAYEVVRVRMKKGQDDALQGGDFVNRMPDGQLLTSDSMKSWNKRFKTELNIHFSYHNLRHTHASYCAALNMPIVKLCRRMGHKKIETTNRYYFGKNEIADEKAIQILNSI